MGKKPALIKPSRTPEPLAHPTLGETNALVAETIEHHAHILPSAEASSLTEAETGIRQYAALVHATQEALKARQVVYDPDFGISDHQTRITKAAGILSAAGVNSGLANRLARHPEHLLAFVDELGRRQRALANLRTRLLTRELEKA